MRKFVDTKYSYRITGFFSESKAAENVFTGLLADPILIALP